VFTQASSSPACRFTQTVSAETMAMIVARTISTQTVIRRHSGSFTRVALGGGFCALLCTAAMSTFLCGPGAEGEVARSRSSAFR
jgi:hypothetical protein